MADTDFEALLAEGDAVPVEGWDFSWFAGRATEERTPWGYSGLLAERLGKAGAALDIQTGGGEVYAEALAASARVPATVAATESWQPNLAIARLALEPFGASIVQVGDTEPLPFGDGSFDLVSSRHPNVMLWSEAARVLAGGGRLLSQQVVGMRTNRELYEYLLGPQHDDPNPGAGAIGEAVTDAGLELTDLRYAESRVEFFDIAAVVYFLRKVLWTVPGFTVDGYRDRLRDLHERILRDGSFVSYSRHALVEARRP